MPRGGARRDRLGGKAVASTLGHRDAILLAGEGMSYRQIAARLGYTSSSAPVHAIDRGIEVSEIRPGLATVILDRVRVLDGRLDARLSALESEERDAADMFGYELHMLGLRLQDTLGQFGRVNGARDVAKLISWRTPGYPPGAGPARDQRLQLRMMEGTLDQIDAGYSDRSGVHRALDRDLRRVLLEAIAWVHRDDLGRLRVSLHDIEVGFRRQHPDWPNMLRVLEEVTALLERLGIVWVVRTPVTVRPPRPAKGVLRPWVADSCTRVAG